MEIYIIGIKSEFDSSNLETTAIDDFLGVGNDVRDIGWFEDRRYSTLLPTD